MTSIMKAKVWYKGKEGRLRNLDTILNYQV